MIITNSSDQSDTKSAPPPSPALQSSAGTSNLPPPPAYSSTPQQNTTHTRQTTTHPQPLTTPILPSESPEMPFLSSNLGVRRAEPACKRFFKAFGIAAVLYVILVMITRSVVASAVTQYLGPPAGPRPSDGNVVKCFPDFQAKQSQVVLSNLPYEHALTYTIPTSSNLVYFLSRGSYGHGTLQFELSDKSGDDIEVNIHIGYQYPTLLQHIKVCRLERNSGEHGIGFFTPEYLGVILPSNMVKFDVIVRFPRPSSSSPLVIKALETNMRIWRHKFDSLQGHVEFQSLSLSASNAAMEMGSVSTTIGKVETSNSPIEGFFNVTDSLVLKTSNSHIKIDVRMENTDGHKPTCVDLKTSNAYISAPISLVTTSSNATYPPAFSVSAVTSNSPLKLLFPNAPTSLPFSKLDVVARTSNSPIDVALHPTFEGTVFQRASIFTPKSEQETGTEDPSGGGRSRSISRRLLGHSLTTLVWWGGDQEKENTGKVVVTTSNSPNVVKLG